MISFFFLESNGLVSDNNNFKCILQKIVMFIQFFTWKFYRFRTDEFSLSICHDMKACK